MHKKCKTLSNIEIFFLARFAHSLFYKIHISEAANRHAPVQYAKYVFFFCLLSNHHDTNPLLTLYFICTFVKKYDYILANINSESSRVIFSFFCLHPVGQTFLNPSKFVTIWSTVLNKKKYLYTCTSFVLVCRNCTLIFSRTRKQNWIIVCQCYLRIWRAGGGGGGGGGGG